MKKEKTKKKKIFRKVLAIILAVIAAFFGITTIITVVCVNKNLENAKSFPAVNTTLDFENVSDGVWNIYNGGKDLKVVQITDVHLGAGWLCYNKDKMSINAVAAMLTAERPDFVIVSGDVSYPVPFQAGTLNNKSAAKIFANLMETLGIYWTVCFGNHDTESYSYFSREDIADFYSSDEYPHCLFQSGPDDVDGCGNQIFNVVNDDGIIVRTFCIFDSHSYVNHDYFGIFWQYDNIHQNQVDWYKNAIQSAIKSNAETVKTLDAEKAGLYAEYAENVKSTVVLHIPLTEYKDAWTEYAENGFKDTENVKYRDGYCGESDMGIYCGVGEDDLFETMLELGSTDTVFCGHDHLNNFSLNYKGINLIYGYSVDYLAYIGIYKLGSQRGCTVLDLSADGTLDWQHENYYQDKYESYFEKESVTMQDLTEDYTSTVE